MDNLILSVNIVLPIFFVIVIGYILKRIGMLTDGFCKAASSLTFYVALPCSLFRSVAGSDIAASLDIKFVIFLIFGCVSFFFICWGAALIFIKDRSKVSAVAHGAFRSNFAYVGMAVISNMLGTDKVPAAVLIVTFGVSLYNILAVILLSYYSVSGCHISLREQLIKIITNPLIIGILLGVPFSVLHLDMPAAMDKTVSYLAQLATPTALLLIGARLDPSTFTKNSKGILIASFLKLVFAPVLYTLLAYIFGFRGEQLVALYVFFGVPSAANVYIMTYQMGGDGELGAGIVMSTSILSVLTLTAGIFLMKTFGFF